MARIYGVQLPQDKPVTYALTYLYGVGLKTAQSIIQEAAVNGRKRVKELSKEEEAAILREIANRKLLIEGDLRKETARAISRLVTNGSYRGSRHKKGLPARGQRTKTNARTRKGPRKAGGQVALKRKVTKK